MLHGFKCLMHPCTASLYCRQELIRLARDMMAGRPSASGPPPPNLHSQQISLLPGVAFDAVPPGSSFGEVVQQVGPQGRAASCRLSIARNAFCRHAGRGWVHAD